MIDLTDAINRASVDRITFDLALWNEALSKFLEETGLINTWDEDEDDDEDIWISIAKEDGKVLLVARSFPFLFVKQDWADYFNFNEYYKNEFVKVFVGDWSEEIYSIELDRLENRFIDWHTDVVNTKSFSIDEFFYATH